MSLLLLTKYKKAFSLIELIVSIGIMLVIISIVIANQSKYTSGASIQNLASDISLSLRQAQIYGISVKEFSPGSNDFTSAYGMNFNITPSGGNNAYIFFADRGVKNGAYDDAWSCSIGGGSECLDKTLLTQGNIINSLCQIPNSGSEVCTIGKIDVTFVRPSTDARILFYNLSGVPLSFSNTKGARIELKSPSGEIRSVVIYSTGQISVQ